ncbi:MAG: hypothetical protein PHW10_05655 [Candidatus Peribacteraceae bacterium]|nr:hypothetical protein [Candidatus Peribacteraceae bacterium]
MPSRFLRSLTSLDTEEQILNVGSLLALAGVCLPWISGEWPGGDVVQGLRYSGFGFFTSSIGFTVFILHLFLLLLTLVPLLGGPVLVRRKNREVVRLLTASAATLLTLAALTVLMRVTFDFTRMEMRFGIYVTLIGSFIAVLYAFLRYQEQRRLQGQELFRHPEDAKPVPEEKERYEVPPPPPPPPPPDPEEHRLYP